MGNIKDKHSLLEYENIFLNGSRGQTVGCLF